MLSMDDRKNFWKSYSVLRFKIGDTSICKLWGQWSGNSSGQKIDGGDE